MFPWEHFSPEAIDSPSGGRQGKGCKQWLLCIAFTIGTGGDELDESPDAKAYAEKIGIEPGCRACDT